MTPTITLGEKSFNGGFEGIAQAIKEISNSKVYVGIPEQETSRPGEGVTNAGLMYIHTHGSQLRHIPARPVIEPAIEVEDNKNKITNLLGSVANAAMDGDKAKAEIQLKKTGQFGSNAAKRWFRDPRNNWPPNAPSTIAAKGSDRPLIDIGELRRSITYVTSYNGNNNTEAVNKQLELS